MTNRTPTAKAAITGADAKNPKRFTGRNEPSVSPIGDPSPHMTEEERTSWLRFTAELPWLVESDRALLEVASALRTRLDTRSGAGLNHLQIYSAILSKLGATPSDRSRVVMLTDPDADPTDRFFPA